MILKGYKPLNKEDLEKHIQYFISKNWPQWKRERSLRKGDGEFNFFFKVENMKLLDGTYDVEISSKNISHYKNKSTDIEYWIALEPESTYTV